MELMLKKSILVLIIVFGITGCLPKPKSRTGDFNAIVLDSLTEEPVPGVNVSIGDKPYTTDLKGQISLAGLAPGDYRIRMIREWYHAKDIFYNHLGKPELVRFYLQPNEELSGRIIYSLYKSKIDRELYVLDLRTRSCSKLKELPDTDETNPCWVSSELIAFQKGRGNNATIQFLNPKSQRIEFFGAGEHPSLDQTGNNMVYKLNGNIIKYEPQTGNTPYTAKGWNPVISRKDSKVAYTKGDRLSLYININGSEISFTPGGNFKLDNPCWSPDGTKIAFEVYTDAKGQRAIYYIQEPFWSAIMQPITKPTGPKEQHHHPTWSEVQENIIYFSANIIYTSRNDIYAVKIGGNFEWVMVSKGSGSKDYPCWGN